MLNLENYRSSSDYREILRILQKASTLEENILWQSHSMGRSIIPIHHMEIDFVSREVVIHFDSKRYSVTSDLPLYVKLDYRTSVFKVEAFREGLSSVSFPFPSELKTQELRTAPRFQFSPQKEKFISVKPSLGGPGRNGGHELNVRAYDASETGMGLIISEHNRAYLKHNRILWVTRLQEELLEVPVLAEVVYINSDVDPKFQTKKQRDLKFGIKFSAPISSDIYQKFIQ